MLDVCLVNCWISSLVGVFSNGATSYRCMPCQRHVHFALCLHLSCCEYWLSVGSAATRKCIYGNVFECLTH